MWCMYVSVIAFDVQNLLRPWINAPFKFDVTANVKYINSFNILIFKIEINTNKLWTEFQNYYFWIDKEKNVLPLFMVSSKQDYRL